MAGELMFHGAVHGIRVCPPYSLSLSPFIANKIILALVRAIHKVKLSDILTGHRGYRADALRQLTIESAGFEIETKITIKAIRNGMRIKEIGVPYAPRNKKEGKKIGFYDFFKIIAAIFKFSWAEDPRADYFTAECKHSSIEN